jgi:WhiB family redox-sensing transcriptional regulator
MDWRTRAACREVDPELFFPVGTNGPALAQIDEAKAICTGCNVTGECLTWAMESGQETGVWGGLSEDERHALRRQRLTPVSSTDELGPQLVRQHQPREGAATLA